MLVGLLTLEVLGGCMVGCVDLNLYWALEYHALILFSLNGTIMKYKFILFSPWLLKSPV